MNIWTIQPLGLVKKVLNGQECFNDIRESETILLDETFPYAYDWMSNRLQEKCSPPDGILRFESDSTPRNFTPCEDGKHIYPFWGWYLIDGRNCRPDFRRFEFLTSRDMAVLGLEVPESQILLSDFDLWHCVLNNSPVLDDEEDLDPSLSKHEVERTWYRIFCVENSIHVQGVFWSIKPSEVFEFKLPKERWKSMQLKKF